MMQKSDGSEACDPRTEERFEAGSSLRLLQTIQQLWTSYAKTGTPTADQALFTEATADGGEQWPACGPDAQVGASNDEPILILGSSKIGIASGHKDVDWCV